MNQLVKNPPSIRETWVRSLVWENPLEKESLPTAVFWPGEFNELYSSWGCKESDMTKSLSLNSLFYIHNFQCKKQDKRGYSFAGKNMRSLLTHCWSHLCCISTACVSFITGSYDRTCKLWDTASGEELHTLEGHRNVVYAIAFNNPYG